MSTPEEYEGLELVILRRLKMPIHLDWTIYGWIPGNSVLTSWHSLDEAGEIKTKVPTDCVIISEYLYDACRLLLRDREDDR